MASPCACQGGDGDGKAGRAFGFMVAELYTPQRLHPARPPTNHSNKHGVKKARWGEKEDKQETKMNDTRNIKRVLINLMGPQ